MMIYNDLSGCLIHYIIDSSCCYIRDYLICTPVLELLQSTNRWNYCLINDNINRILCYAL